MFETRDSSKMDVPIELLSEGQHIWKSVSVRLHVPCFYVMYQKESKNYIVSTHMDIVSSEEQITDMASAENIKIIDVYLVSPGSLNGSNRWKMEQLREIWTAKTKALDTDKMGMIYVLRNNREYIYSPSIEINEKPMKNNLLIKI